MKKTPAYVYVLACLFCISCATTVPVTVTRPAKVNLNGAKKIAVQPFEASISQPYTVSTSALKDDVSITAAFSTGSSDDAKESAGYLTAELSKRLARSSYLTLMDAKAGGGAEIYISGKITRFEFYNESLEGEELIDGKRVTGKFWVKHVTASVSYQIAEAATGKILAQQTEDIMALSDRQKEVIDLPSPLTVLETKLDRLATRIVRQVQPYTVTLSLSLKNSKDKSGDAKEAAGLVKAGKTQEGEEKYYTAYQNSGDFACGYNAAKLMQALGKLPEAEQLMSKLVKDTGDKDAVSALGDIRYEIGENEKLKEQQQ